MYGVIKSVINSGKYELAEMLAKIDTFWVQGSITDAEREELIALAREKAIAENSHADLREQVANLYINMGEMAKEMKSMKAEIKALKGEDVTPDEEESVDEYPEYVQPTGAHDAYYAGAKVTHNGLRYICIAPEGVAVVWSPEVYPDYWELVIEE